MKGKKIVSGIMLSVVIVGIFGSVFNPKPALSSEVYSQEKAPDFTLTDIYGETFCLYDCSAKVVLIEFFGTWCSPCVQQTPALRNIYENYSRDQLEMISVSSEDEGVLRNFTKEHDIEWIVARDTAGVMNEYGVQYIPTIFLVDAQHYIRYKHVGLTEESTLGSEIESLLPKTIYVDDDNTAGPWNGTPEHPYQNITSGLEHASAGDTLYVCNGTYYENVVVNKTVSLIGENRESTIIDGKGAGDVVTVTASNVTVSDFTIQKGYYYGIWLDHSNNSVVTSNNITNNNLGIMLGWSSSANISKNIVTTNKVGIKLEYSSNCLIYDNYARNNSNGLGLFYSENSIITGNFMTDNKEGIYFSSSSNNSIVGNNITDNDSGIRLEYSDNNTISENTIGSSLYVGVGLGESSDYNTVGRNSISNNAWAAVKLYKAANNDIHKNNVTNNYQGIWLEWHSVENTIGINVIANNSGYGVSIQTFSNATVEGNSITNNEWGLFIFSNDSTIYHNNFINNTNQATNYREEMENIWDDDYPSGGNYWSDYNGTDVLSGLYQNETGSDGIGDTPYVIDGGNQDNYPLMRPYAPLIGDLNGDGKVDVQDLVLFIKAFGSYPSHPRWNPSADLNNDNKVDIMDMVLLIKSFGKHYP